MRSILVAGFAVLCGSGSVSAQECERMTLKNDSGQIISETLMCMGNDGVWANDPAPQWPEAKADSAPEPAVLAPAITPLPEPPVPEPRVVEPIATEAVELHKTLLAPVSTPLPPALLQPETVEIPREPTVIETAVSLGPAASGSTDIAPLAAESTVPFTAPVETPVPLEIPAGAASQRQETYAKLGLVCVAEQAVFCSGDCTGKCQGKQGWCDGRSGKIYPSLEAIERRHCRPK